MIFRRSLATLANSTYYVLIWPVSKLIDLYCKPILQHSSYLCWREQNWSCLCISPWLLSSSEQTVQCSVCCSRFCFGSFYYMLYGDVELNSGFTGKGDTMRQTRLNTVNASRGYSAHWVTPWTTADLFFDVKQSCRAWNLSLMTINNTVSDGRSEKGLNWQTTGWTMCAYCNIRHYSWAEQQWRTPSVNTQVLSRIFFRKQNVYATLELSVGVHTPQRRYVLDLLILGYRAKQTARGQTGSTQYSLMMLMLLPSSRARSVQVREPSVAV